MRPRWIIWYACILHGLWGVLLLFSPDPLGITAAHPLAILGRFGAAAVLCVVAAAAARGLRHGRVLFLLPQQALLVTAALSAVVAVADGHFADGVPHPALFILADQAPALLVAVLHTLAVSHIHREAPAVRLGTEPRFGRSTRDITHQAGREGRSGVRRHRDPRSPDAAR